GLGLRSALGSRDVLEPSCCTRCLPAIARRGFTLVELMVVLAIVVILTSLLMPGLRTVRESANRLSCGNNMRQIGYALTSYANDNSDFLPASSFATNDVKLPQELMAVTTGGAEAHFEGIGRLLPHCGGYLDSPGCLYCASHHGEHSLERYADAFDRPAGNERAYSNYHFRGDNDPVTGTRYRLDNEHSFLLLTDGLRTRSDFNHGNGMNLLHGDLAISFFADVDGGIFSQLPEVAATNSQVVLFNQIWAELGSNAQ
ncbi:MAG: type II secretion system protein, partial [Phycisphaerae bacterium]|nr:type II secretion system protein [Phycisphaerae bacterium]